MMKRFLIAAMIGMSLTVSAQYDRGDSNRIGIHAGINQFTLFSDDVESEPGTGWNAGLSLRGNVFRNLDMVYGIQFSENNFSVATNAGDVDMKLAGAHLSLFLSYKLIPSHLSVEIGPVVQINGDLTFNEESGEAVVSSTDLTVKELSGTSRFNFYPAVGITGGLTRLRLNVSYQYGINNLVKANGVSARGGILSANVIFYL